MPGYGNAARVPDRLQAHILKKVLSMTDRYKDAKQLVIAFRSDKSGAEGISKEFSKVGFQVTLSQDYPLVASERTLVYLYEVSDEAIAFCDKQSVLCLGGSVDFVKDGVVEVAIGTRRNRPKIFLDLKSLRLKGIKVRQ